MPGSERTFLCPSDRRRRSTAPRSSFPTVKPRTDYGPYGMNAAPTASAGDGQTPPRSTAAAPVRASLLAAPPAPFAVADTNNREEANGSFGFTWANAARQSRHHDRLSPSVGKNHRAPSAERQRRLLRRPRRKLFPLEAFAATKQIIDPVTGESKSVMTLFTIEAD